MNDPLRTKSLDPSLPSRRAVLRGAAALSLSGAAARAATLPGASSPSGDGSLVLVHLSGGLDGLVACTPLFEGAALAAQRPGLLVPTAASAGALRVPGGPAQPGDFALHPGLQPLAPALAAGELALVHAAGSADPTRSHFAARDANGAGVPSAPGAMPAADGWVARALAALPERSAAAPRALALGSTLPRALRRAPRALSVRDPRGFASYGISSTLAARRASLASMLGGAFGAPGSGSGTGLQAEVERASRDAHAAIGALGAVDFDRTPAGGAAYPGSLLGRRMFDAATVLRSGLGTEVVYVDSGADWDDHDQMGPVTGGLAARLADLGQALAAFRTDLGPAAFARTTVAVFGEFGRRVDQNASGGTDHGRGGAVLVLGGGVRGGSVLGAWPGLAPAELDDGALAVTTDLRSILGELLAVSFGAASVAPAFPGHVPARVGLV
ncbi:MAG: DUF1501 domain-containing protein [Planctomycetota bacterium]